MQINDDPLIEVIARAESEFYREPLNSFASLPAALAAAVRSFMGSDEMVDKSAAAMADEVNLTFSGFDERTQSKYRRQARAALSAAIGEDIGGGRG